MYFRQKCFLIFKKGKLKDMPMRVDDFMNAVSSEVKEFLEEVDYRTDVYADIIALSYEQAGSWIDIEEPLMKNLNDQELVDKITQKYVHQEAIADSKILTGKNYNCKMSF